MKIVFLSFPDYGHIYPTLELVNVLTKKGIEIIYYSSTQFKQDIENAGAEFRSYPANSFVKKNLTSQKNKKNDFVDAYYSLFHYIIDNYQNIIELLYQECSKDNANVIIHDSFALWGPVLAQKFNIPNVCSITSIAYPLKDINAGFSHFIEKFHPPFRRRFVSNVNKRIEEIIIKQIKQKCNIELHNLLKIYTNYSKLNIVYTSKSVQPFIQDFDKSFLFIGKRIKPEKNNFDIPFLQEQDKPLIYISLGTVFFQHIIFYKRCIEALKSFNCNVILSINNEGIINELGVLPNNIRVYQFVPQTEVLKKSSLFITHGGFNSITESLYYGIPMIIFPQALDQFINAKIIHDIKCGIYLKNNNPSVGKLKKIISKLLKVERYKINCQEVGRSLNDDNYELVYNRLLSLVDKENYT